MSVRPRSAKERSAALEKENMARQDLLNQQRRANHRTVLQKQRDKKLEDKVRADQAKCKTPGALYSISILNPPQVVSVSVELPASVDRMNQQTAIELEEKLHKAVERVLAGLFHRQSHRSTP
ncbi:hypothetical protein ACSFA8_20865 [Variovorax sp. RT4R15]|uniref:hypothetical protein n=1 Tax=Variovorax sp. RT4R15 TaxID=3443737 RepID=UPI003F485D8F